MKRLVIVGAGFAGLELARRLSHSELEITLIDRTNHHLFQPLLYQVATAKLAPSDIATPIRALFKGNPRVSVWMDEAIALDPERRRLELLEQGAVEYDLLVLAMGNATRLPLQPAWSDQVYPLKTLEDARKLRERVLQIYERAEWRGKVPHFVVVGGGPTGVETAGSLAELAHGCLRGNFRRMPSDRTQITLLESGSELLHTFKPNLGRYTAHTLEKLGVRVISSAKIEQIGPGLVQLANERLEPDLVIWTAGTEATPFAQRLGIELTSQGRILVDERLRVVGLSDVYAIGDCAHFEQKGHPLPALAPVAKQQGHYLAKQLLGRAEAPFHYLDKGTLAMIGQHRALGEVKGIAFKGRLAWFLWLFVHIFYLIGFGNKLFVLTKWLWGSFSGARSCRLIEAATRKERVDTQAEPT